MITTTFGGDCSKLYKTILCESNDVQIREQSVR
jgi:hypothetical protein